MPSITDLIPAAASVAANPATAQAALVKTALQSQPAYVTNRERAAVVLDTGFRVSDGYTKAKPFLFVGALIGAAVSSTALYKRHRRGSETVVLWSATFLASVATAWITRPTIGSRAPANASAAQKQNLALVDMIDRRRATLRAQDPNFADKAFARFESIPSIKAGLDSSPLLKAAL